ncbi:hypothetical protein, partial [Bacteroides acidifaciens]|uniref:hypothetical protein n=1 Tax=Bacteroides acidifaciens TaxID=85831 RepID=UPI00258542ED
REVRISFPIKLYRPLDANEYAIQKARLRKAGTPIDDLDSYLILSAPADPVRSNHEEPRD